MRLLQIDYFLKTAELLNFTKAASELYVSQPALSKQIALLEEEIGTPLFIRTSRHVQLTEAGIQFQNDLLAIRKSLDEAIKRVSSIEEKEKQTIRVGSFDGRTTDDYLAVLYKKIQAIDTKLEVDLKIASFTENTENLRDEKIDWMITLDELYVPEEGDFQARLIRRERAIGYSKRLIDKTPETVLPSDFSGLPLLLPEKDPRHSINRKIIHTVSELHIHPSQIIECDNFNTMYLKLEMGEGFSVLGNDIGKRDPAIKCMKLGPENDMWLLVVVKSSNTKAKKLFDKAFPRG